MKLKFKIISLATALIVIVLFVGLGSPSDSLLSWYVGTTKSELWAASQQFKLDSQPVGLETAELTSSQEPELSTTSSLIAKNNNKLGMTNFPLGWYDSVTNLATLNQIASEGMNMVVPYRGKSSIQQMKAYLDRAAAVGIKVMVEIPRDEVRRDHRWVITQLVKQLKTHPAVLGWYLFDEPEYIQLSPQILERVYQAIKAEDPQHTVAIAFGKLVHIRKYLKALDTVMYFRYPITEDSPEFEDLQDGTFSKMVNTAGSLVKPKNLWFILQGYGRDQQGRSVFKRRLPTAAEERYMVYSAILAQADGLFFWTHYRSQQQWIDSVLTPIVQELKTYLPAINSGVLNSKLTAENSRVQARLYRNPTTQDLLLVAINHSNQELETAIAIQKNLNSAQLKSNRSVNISRGVLRDVFEPYGVHIYRLK